MKEIHCITQATRHAELFSVGSPSWGVICFRYSVRVSDYIVGRCLGLKRRTIYSNHDGRPRKIRNVRTR